MERRQGKEKKKKELFLKLLASFTHYSPVFGAYQLMKSPWEYMVTQDFL